MDLPASHTGRFLREYLAKANGHMKRNGTHLNGRGDVSV
jgi:hypothetical protein